MQCVSIFWSDHAKSHAVGTGLIKLGLLDFSVSMTSQGGNSSTHLAYILTASEHVLSYSIVMEASQQKATELWRMPVKLYMKNATEFYQSNSKSPKPCLTCDWPGTIAVNTKYMLVQSEEVRVYQFTSSKSESKPTGGIKVQGFKQICYTPCGSFKEECINQDMKISCGQIAFHPLQENIAFGLTGTGHIFKITLSDTPQATFLAKFGSTLTKGYPPTGLAVEASEFNTRLFATLGAGIYCMMIDD